MRQVAGELLGRRAQAQIAHSGILEDLYNVYKFTCDIYVCVCVCVCVYGPSPMAQVVKNPPAKAGDAGLIPRLEKSPGGGNGTPVFLPGESHGAWWAIACTASQTQLSTRT